MSPESRRPALSALNQEIADLLEQGVIVLDHSLAIVVWNKWMESVTGLPLGSVVGKSIYAIFPELTGTERALALDRALAGEVVLFSHRFHEYFLPLSPPVGFPEMRRMQQTARICPRIEGGRIIGVAVVLQDVTERTVREAELRSALERAEIANRAKADFLSSMSHELRTPLNVVLGYADLLTSEIGGTLNADQFKKLDRIKTSVWHLLDIIDEILLFSRVEAGKETVKYEEVDLVGLIRDTVVMLQNDAAARGIALELPQDVESFTIETDPRRVRQILLNLLGNGLKFTDHGTVRATLEVCDRVVQVHVSDTGRGIETHRLEDVFEPFTRVESPEGPSGTGLGLPLSRRLAQLMGGNVTGRSEKGVGSTFTLTLPRTPPPPPAPDPV